MYFRVTVNMGIFKSYRWHLPCSQSGTYFLIGRIKYVYTRIYRYINGSVLFFWFTKKFNYYLQRYYQELTTKHENFRIHVYFLFRAIRGVGIALILFNLNMKKRVNPASGKYFWKYLLSKWQSSSATYMSWLTLSWFLSILSLNNNQQ